MRTWSIEECWHKLRTLECITRCIDDIAAGYEKLARQLQTPEGQAEEAIARARRDRNRVVCSHDGCDFPSGKCIWKCTADGSD